MAERSGRYALDVAPGRYALLLETADAAAIPVLAPPVRLGAGTLVRRDVRLVEADPATVSARLGLLDASFGEWWKTVPPGGKAAFVAGIMIGVGFGVAAFGGGADETPASPF